MTVGQLMEEFGAVRVPPERADFERWSDEMSEFAPTTKGFWIEHGVVHTYPRERRTGDCGCASRPHETKETA